MADELEQIFPQSKDLNIHGEVVAVSPLKMRQIPKVSAHMMKLFQYVDREEVNIAGLLSEGSMELVEAISAAVDKPKDWVEDLGLDEMVLLTRTVIEVNSDFFSRCVLPEINQAKEVLNHLTGLVSSRS